MLFNCLKAKNNENLQKKIVFLSSDQKQLSYFGVMTNIKKKN